MTSAGVRYLRATSNRYDPSVTMHAVVYPLVWRLGAAALVASSRVALPVLLAFVLFSRNPPILPFMLMRAFAILVIGPATAAWLIERAFAARVEVTGGELVLQHRWRRTEIPCSAIARVSPWMVPLPGIGVSLRLRSGRRFRYGMQLPDPRALVEALATAGAGEAAGASPSHPNLVYAHAKHAGPPQRWSHFVAKFVGFGLVPTLPLFRVHQYIAYGGTFGEYYLIGLGSYLRTFAIYWTTLIIYLILYAGLLRGVCETVALGAAWVAPSRAARVRRAVELAHRILYYGGVPVFVILRFLPW